MTELIKAATPLTSMRYTKNPEGAIVRYEANFDNYGPIRIKNRTPIMMDRNMHNPSVNSQSG
jgi:hypothetical protein